MLSTFRHVYFLGIGGIGMSALARYCLRSGISISGFDRECTELTKKLEAEGMRIRYKMNPSNLPDTIDLLVYTPAISVSNREFVELSGRGIPVMKRSEALQMALDGKRVIAVAGTHGKTTTSAILSHILNWKRSWVTCFVGGIMSNTNSNFIYGDSEWVVIEADEYDRSFLRLSPEIALIQALDADHLDIYGDPKSMIKSFVDFTERILKGGSLWLSRKAFDGHWNEEWSGRMEKGQVAVETFGGDSGDDAVYLTDLKQEGPASSFRLHIKGRAVDVKSSLAGKHNAVNTAGAAAIANSLGIEPEHIAEAIGRFKGIKRRFETVFRRGESVVIDDYAHHPVEIAAAIEAARSHYTDRWLTVVFQPHLYSRTRDFAAEFAASLDEADEVFLLPIYPAREKPIAGVTTRDIDRRMKNRKVHLVSFDDLPDAIKLRKRHVILVLGAGDIYRLIPGIIQRINDV